MSIIVCTRNRVGDLEGCIKAICLASKIANEARIRLIVVNNGSTDWTEEELRRLEELLNVKILVVEEKTPGLSRARNAGLRVADEGLIIFVDDDCHMDPNYLRCAISANAEDDDLLVLRGGRVLLGSPKDLPFTIKTSDVPARWSRSQNDTARYNLANTILGANLAFRKELFDKVGLFDERLGAGTSLPGGEDTDFIFRCYLEGVPIVYDPELIVHHFHGRRKKSEAWSLLRNYSLGGGALVAKYLFVSPSLVKQFRWDFKEALKEMFNSKNTFHPDVGFSNKDKFLWQVRGALRFIKIASFKRM